jgi:hypothetical protein
MAVTYAKIGPPFDFLGNFSESQKNAFSSWVTARSANLPAIQLFHQVRAQQLRKSAGMLEHFYATSNIEPLATAFVKEAWQPGPNGHWAYAFRNDQIPAQTVSEIKKHFRYLLERQDEAIFHMNHLRNQIESSEDKAQYANEAPVTVAALMDRVEALFTQPEYQAALIRDLSDKYQNQPRYRSSQMDPPTPWENFLHNHGAASG